MMNGKIVFSCLGAAGICGTCVGSKFINDSLSPSEKNWICPSSELTFKEENWDEVFQNPGACVKKLFPELSESTFIPKKKINKTYWKPPATVNVFGKGKTSGEKPAIGCVIMNVKKMIYGPNKYWRAAYRGEIVLRTEKEAWIWFMGSSTGNTYSYKNIALEKDAGGKWEVKAGIGGNVDASFKNLPHKSPFWNIDLTTLDDRLECVEDKDRNLYQKNICIAWKYTSEKIESENWSGAWIEGAGNQPFSAWVSNPSDIVYAWPPKHPSTQTNYSVLLEAGSGRETVLDNKGWYKDTSDVKKPGILWKWRDDRRGLWIDMPDLCSHKDIHGMKKGRLNSVKEIFCS